METRSPAVAVLATDHLGLVGQVVRSVSVRYPRHVDRNDLWNAGALGLVEAASRYDPSSEIPFERYAAIRIRGAIIDSTRTRDWATRTLRRDLREMRQAERDLERTTGPADDEHVANAIGITREELARRRSHEIMATLLHLDQVAGDDGTLGDVIQDPSPLTSPDARLEHKELLGTLREAVKGLHGRQQEIIQRYYLDGHLMRDIADDLGITEARVSQIRSETLAAMRAYFSTLYEEITPVEESVPGKRARSVYVESVAAQSGWRTRIEV
ncbi:MAG: sigma-70 family RNA polymerase sigma factor [Acidimicrobiia bacterium]|nr:sigma-70 family RNA polymerase sigma factor [Acidimicrobiia bacterium]